MAFMRIIIPLALIAGIVPSVWGQDVTYPESLFNDGKARFFVFKMPEGIKIRYFILKSPDGVIRSAFDACDACWREGKGYAQKDEFMVCKNCGKRFHTNKINEVYGGCNPAPLVRVVQDGKVVIRSEHLLQGKKYFDLKGGGK